jgi:hypothetical protein
MNMKRRKAKPYIICIILILSACSPQKRLQRLVARHPELIRMDTVRFQKTLVVPARTAAMHMPADRFFSDLQNRQPIVVTDFVTGITVNISNNENDTIAISVTVPPDSIKIDEPIPVPTITVEQSRHDWRQDLKIFLLLLVAMLLLIFLIRMFRK